MHLLFYIFLLLHCFTLIMATIDETVKQLIELGAQYMKKSGIDVSSYSEKDVQKINIKDIIQNEIRFNNDVVLTKQLINVNDLNGRNKIKNEINFAKWMERLFKEESPAFKIFACIDEKQAILTEFSTEGSLADHLKKGPVNLEYVKLIATSLFKIHNATNYIQNHELFSQLSQSFGECKLEEHQPYLSEVFATKNKSLIISHISGETIYIKNKIVKFLTNSSCIGPRSLDLGHLVAEYLIQYHLHILTEQDNDKHRKIAYQMIEATTATISTYCELFGLEADQTKDFIWEVSMFAGEEIINRAKLMFNDHRLAEISSSGHRLINARVRITDEHRLVNIALMLTF